MIDARQYPKQFLTEFLELYKSLPCLWKKKCKDYTNKPLKTACYQKMADKLKESIIPIMFTKFTPDKGIHKQSRELLENVETFGDYDFYEPNATRDIVKKKINSLRVSRRKEWIKVQNSIESGGELYQPNLWYYHLLDFLEECDEPDDSTSDYSILSDPIGLPESDTKTEPPDETNRPSYELSFVLGGTPSDTVATCSPAAARPMSNNMIDPKQYLIEDPKQYSRQVITEFLELYKSFPCLWKRKCIDYTNRRLKTACYDKMVDKLKEYDPNATRETVRRKINTLRTNRRKEMNKIKNSIESGGGVHQPNLWYYHLLDFLDDDEPDDSTSDHCISLDPISLPKTKTEALDETNRLSSEEFEPFQDNVSESNSHSSQYVIEVQDVDYDSPGTSYRAPVHKRPRLPKKKLTHSKVEEAEGYEDRFDIFGKSVAMKMRGLSSQQRLVAEKIINDTLFKAEMGILRLSDAMDLKH